MAEVRHESAGGVCQPKSSGTHILNSTASLERMTGRGLLQELQRLDREVPGALDVPVAVGGDDDPEYATFLTQCAANVEFSHLGVVLWLLSSESEYPA